MSPVCGAGGTMTDALITRIHAARFALREVGRADEALYGEIPDDARWNTLVMASVELSALEAELRGYRVPVSERPDAGH